METSLTNELISKVLNVNVQTKIHKDDLCSDNILIYWEFDGYHNECRNINIYELANKCKDWAATKGYVLFSKTRLNSSLASCYFDTIGRHDYEDDFHNDFRAETEPEAVFKACEWIRKKLKG